ncbi:hypothetical protein LPL18_007425 [Halomonas sp. CUBES01]|uniref:Uncharacterized protein n=1 Tax=Vreelandella gomseomensis TaxID=370766 RepID=A0ABU1G9B9_9GAMM|nr:MULTISPECIES: hypothetical protein [Halomonas]MDR5874090.1 hypothetical protein [Halomonas gomseomensis]MEC4767167.1 hypothetical protein [Halomonas sp. CUBES01]
MQRTVTRWLKGAVIGASVIAISGCGTLFHPERKGQLSGDIDPVVAVANGVGLLFFIVPGVIAYAVDFSNGTIYLPSRTSGDIDTQPLDGNRDIAALEKLLSEQAGQPVSLEHELMKVEAVDSLDEALAMVRMSGVMDDDRLSAM